MFNKHLKKIDRTSYYNFDRSKYLRLDRNERTIPFNEKVLKDLKNNIFSNTIQSYPMEVDKLKKLISKKEKFNQKYINIVDFRNMHAVLRLHRPNLYFSHFAK